MRRIEKSQTTNALVVYAAKNPNGTWDCFQKNNNKDCRAIKTKIFEEQHYICAYCEIDLSLDSTYEHHRRVEHFNSKSGWKIGQPQPNFHLEWNNVFGVCVGGTDKKSLEHYMMPDNKSCDAYKEHLETNCGYDKIWKGKVVSPLEPVLCSEMFNYCLSSGKLSINQEYANSLEFNHNDYDTSSELLEKTLCYFNINCERLNVARREVQYAYERLKANFRKSNDVDKFKFMVQKWSGSEKTSSFQTTRDILLRNCKVANKVLKYPD